MTWSDDPLPTGLPWRVARALRWAGVTLAEADDLGPYHFQAMKLVGGTTVSDLGHCLHEHGFTGWHWSWEDRRYRKGADPDWLSDNCKNS
jgi:hypothetical protein